MSDATFVGKDIAAANLTVHCGGGAGDFGGRIRCRLFGSQLAARASKSTEHFRSSLVNLDAARVARKRNSWEQLMIHIRVGRAISDLSIIQNVGYGGGIDAVSYQSPMMTFIISHDNQPYHRAVNSVAAPIAGRITSFGMSRFTDAAAWYRAARTPA